MSSAAANLNAYARDPRHTDSVFESGLELAPCPAGVEVCGCEESIALRHELAFARRLIAGPAPADGDGRVFCPQCGLGGLGRGVDSDGCCSGCGATVCSLDELAGHLAVSGFRVEPVHPAVAERNTLRIRLAGVDGRRHALEQAWCEGGGDGLD